MTASRYCSFRWHGVDERCVSGGRRPAHDLARVIGSETGRRQVVKADRDKARLNTLLPRLDRCSPRIDEPSAG